MSKLKKISVLFCAVLVVVLIVGFMWKKTKSSAADMVEEYFALMLKEDVSWSSNPYDYMNQEYYDKVVALGFSVVPIIEEGYYNGKYGGFNGWMAGSAIQDITNMKLNEAVGVQWGKPEEFFENWDATMKDLPNLFEKIMDSEDSVAGKIEEIEKFGIFGQYFLTKLADEKETTVEMNGAKISVTGYEEMDLRGIDKLSAKEMKEVEDYLKSR